MKDWYGIKPPRFFMITCPSPRRTGEAVGAQDPPDTRLGEQQDRRLDPYALIGAEALDRPAPNAYSGETVFPGDQPDMSQLLEQAAKMQQQLMQAQEELERAEVEGTAGGGLVTATVTGSGELVRLSIQREACDLDDPDGMEALADLVVAAVRDGNAAASRLAQDRLGPLTEGLGGGLSLPGI